MNTRSLRIATLCGLLLAAPMLCCAANDARESALRDEIAGKGWIAFSARAKNGTWDLFLCRPDGTSKRNITNTADFEEAAPRFSPDGRKLLYRRMAKATEIDHDLWGFLGELVVANADGSGSVVVGKDREFPWASWSPDGSQMVCLTRKEIQVVDFASKKVVRTLPRKGIYQQLFWSPDGRWFTGTGNHAGTMWTVVRMNAETGDLNAVLEFQSCTPDWCPDSEQVIFSSRPKDQKANDGYGWTQLWVADGEGKQPRLIFGEDGAHIYGGSTSPDGHYVLFTKCESDGGGSEKSGGPMFVMRYADAPTIAGESTELRTLHPNTEDGPVLQFGAGWEPSWTYTEIADAN